MKPGKVVQQITHIVHFLPIKKQDLCHMKRVKSEEWDLLENEMAQILIPLNDSSSFMILLLILLLLLRKPNNWSS